MTEINSEMFKPLSEPNRTTKFLLEKTKFRHIDWFPKVILSKIWNSFNLELRLLNRQGRLSANFSSSLNIKTSDAQNLIVNPADIRMLRTWALFPSLCALSSRPRHQILSTLSPGSTCTLETV